MSTPSDDETTRYQKLAPLRDRRETIGLSQELAANTLGVHRTTLSDWEGGKRDAPKSHRKSFIHYLRRDLELADEPQEFQKIWDTVMVGVWQWLPLSERELGAHSRSDIEDSSPSTPEVVQPTLTIANELPGPNLAPKPLPYPLVGRDNLLRDIRQQLLAGNSPTVALTGIPGIGKTALAVALAHDYEVLDYFRDGVLWVGLRPKADVDAGLEIWGSTLGISSFEMAKLNSLEEKRNAVSKAIGTRRILLVVDGVWEVEAARCFKLAGPNCAYIVTTNLRDIAADVASNPLTVRELNETDSLELLSRFVPEGVQSAPREARLLANKAGGLPLKIAVIGNVLLRYTGASSSGWQENFRSMSESDSDYRYLPLEQEPAEYHPGIIGAVITMDAIMSMHWNTNTFDLDALGALHALSMLPPKPNTFSQDDVRRMGWSSSLAKLVNYGLVEKNSLGRYTVPRAIADYCKPGASF